MTGQFCGTNEDMYMLQQYSDVYNKYLKDGVIDLDKRLGKQFNFQIYRIEDVVQSVRGIVPPGRQTPYWITFVKKGTGEKMIGTFTFPIQDNLLFIVPKQVIHSSRYTSSVDTAGYILNFSIDFFSNKPFPVQYIADRKVLKNSIRPYLHVDEKQKTELSEIFEYILKEHGANEHENKLMIAIKILELLIYCDRIFAKANLINDEIMSHPTVDHFNELVENNYNKKRMVHFYANALNVHPNHLNFLLKKYSTMTAKQNINKRIIVEAKFLLVSSKLHVKQIALRLGFVDANNFSSFFQKLSGISPLAYRKNAGGPADLF
ncbi:helix-turn-helix domain-containing protein [Mucilaginibacter sp. ZT4R22]|uniref:Helix-turn-helix domain-containing protein n=1 Tax=Mucilaginibacter pankratovii TaxID=2772110 RepID=A0ABR7WSX1_9SPHI|nr:helix-turn-helix domain-containing protein [Mucilaginibacter pankratovii]MBD1365414.1 helix-turn-helix domain-containing protein [Mucilaginibacter pankratovii]